MIKLKRNPIIKCNKCEKEFKLKPRDLKVKTIDNIEVKYFNCKHCKEIYIYSCFDDYINSKQKEYKDLEAKIKTLYNKFIKNDSQQLLKEIMDSRNKKLNCLKDMKKHSDSLIRKVKDKV